MNLALTDVELKSISRLAWVDAAKKNAPPIAATNLLAISKTAREMPSAASAEPRDVIHYLSRGSNYLGAGILVLICMLAVETDGDYPPMDRKFASGLRAQKKISLKDLERLNGKNLTEFAKVYVHKVIPAWCETRKGRSPEEADRFWGCGGTDG